MTNHNLSQASKMFKQKKSMFEVSQNLKQKILVFLSYPKIHVSTCKHIDLNHVNEVREAEAANLMFLFKEHEQAIGNHCYVDLRKDCIFGLAVELFYMEVLLHGFEEQLDTPSFFIKP